MAKKKANDPFSKFASTPWFDMLRIFYEVLEPDEQHALLVSVTDRLNSNVPFNFIDLTIDIQNRNSDERMIKLMAQPMPTKKGKK